MWDLPETPEVLVSFGTLLGGSAAIWGAFTAHRGLRAWRTQNREEYQSQLARKILVQLYRYRDAIEMFRIASIWRSEVEGVLSEEERAEDVEFQRYLEMERAYERRYEKIATCRADLYPLQLEADAAWPLEFDELLKPLWDLEVELKMNLVRYLRNANPRNDARVREIAGRKLDEGREVLFDALEPEEDTFWKDLTDGIKAAENFLRTRMEFRA